MNDYLKTGIVAGSLLLGGLAGCAGQQKKAAQPAPLDPQNNLIVDTADGRYQLDLTGIPAGIPSLKKASSEERLCGYLSVRAGSPFSSYDVKRENGKVTVRFNSNASCMKQDDGYLLTEPTTQERLVLSSQNLAKLLSEMDSDGDLKEKFGFHIFLN